jgi:hypothetical protein
VTEGVVPFWTGCESNCGSRMGVCHDGKARLCTLMKENGLQACDKLNLL